MPRTLDVRRVLALVTLAVVATVAVTACSTTSGGTPVTLSTTTTAGADGPTTTTTAEPAADAGTQLFVYAPVEGDCIDVRTTTDDGGAATTPGRPDEDATPRGEQQLVLRLDCQLPHQYEVIAVVEADPASEATDEALTAEAKRLCPSAFEPYIGTPYQASGLEVGWSLPTGEQQARGSRQIGCVAFDPEGKLTESVRGTGR